MPKRERTVENQTYEILNKIQNSADVRALPEDQIEPLCAELRRFLIEKVTKNGGHLASNLGVVELSVAIHRVFDLPHDRVIFDVGHQSYVHKILSGRRDAFDTLRKPGGLSGFEKMSESEYDAFGTGHASTSLSAALGYAKADKIMGRDNYTIVVLGDGAFTGGLVHEALNNCDPDLRLIVILNENEMSISKNIGTFARHIANIRSSKRYINLKKRTTRFAIRADFSVLCFLPRQENADQSRDQGEGRQTDKTPFKGMDGHPHEGSLRGAVIPAQVGAVHHHQNCGNGQNAHYYAYEREYRPRV